MYNLCPIYFYNRYAKEYDPDNWFTIDPITAEIRLTKVPDRESIYVVDGSYVAKILAISEGNNIAAFIIII